MWIFIYFGQFCSVYEIIIDDTLKDNNYNVFESGYTLNVSYFNDHKNNLLENLKKMILFNIIRIGNVRLVRLCVYR